MLGTCGCGKPTASKGLTCDSCLGEAHRPRPKRRAKQLIPPPLKGSIIVEVDGVPTELECEDPRTLPIVEPPVYSSKPPTKPEGRKWDNGKSRMSLAPAIAMVEVGHVLAYGAAKYTEGDSPGEANWTKVERAVERYGDAALRHIYAWLGGERNDPETNRHHLAHCICCCLFILWFELTGRKQ